MEREVALIVEKLGKSFRVPHSADRGDPRRERISRGRDLFHALRDVSFEIYRGETVGIIGPNGSGKSTLLKILCGVSKADAGIFDARGRIGALLELGAGFHPDLTGIENIYLSGALIGMDIRQVDALLPEIIGFAELERFMDMPVKHYSSGMIGRLGFAVATRLAPEILLMDETFATGDLRFQAKAIEHVASMKGRGHTLLIVSHNLEIVSQLADRVLWLDRGQVHMVGEPREVLSKYRRARGHSLDKIAIQKSALGAESLFEPVAGNSGVSISLGFPPPGGIVEIAQNEPVQVSVTIAHPPSLKSVFLETAWVRAEDGRLFAQSRAQAGLSPSGRSEITLDFGPWPLTEGTWRMSVAVASGAEYLARAIDAAALRVTTPNPYELPVILNIPVVWSQS